MSFGTFFVMSLIQTQSEIKAPLMYFHSFKRYVNGAQVLYLKIHE